MEKLSKSLEKYLFAVFELSKIQKKLTPKIVGEKLGFNKASTLDGIKGLKNKGLVEYIPYKGLKLTDLGRKYAEKLDLKKEIISNYLEKFLLLKGKTLDVAINSIKYEADDELVERLKFFLDFLEFCPKLKASWLMGFENFIKNGEMGEFCTNCLIENKGEETECKICNK